MCTSSSAPCQGSCLSVCFLSRSSWCIPAPGVWCSITAKAAVVVYQSGTLGCCWAPGGHLQVLALAAGLVTPCSRRVSDKSFGQSRLQHHDHLSTVFTKECNDGCNLALKSSVATGDSPEFVQEHDKLIHIMIMVAIPSHRHNQEWARPSYLARYSYFLQCGKQNASRIV